jgi:hypothetical protein
VAVAFDLHRLALACDRPRSNRSPLTSPSKRATRYFSSMAIRSPPTTTRRSRRMPLSGRVSSLICARGLSEWISQARACWKSASEWKIGRPDDSRPIRPCMSSPISCTIRPGRDTVVLSLGLAGFARLELTRLGEHARTGTRSRNDRRGLPLGFCAFRK